MLAAVAWWCGVAGCVGLCVGITRVPLVCCVGFELVKQSINQSINQSARRVIAQANTATRTPAIGRGGGWRGLACSHATSFATTHQHWCCFDYPKVLLASQRAPLKNARAHVLTVETGWLRKFPRGPFNGRAQTTRRGGATSSSACGVHSIRREHTTRRADPNVNRSSWLVFRGGESIDPTSIASDPRPRASNQCHCQKHRQRARPSAAASLLLNASERRTRERLDREERERPPLRSHGPSGGRLSATELEQIRGLSIRFTRAIDRSDRSIDLTARPNNQKAPPANRRSASWCAPVERRQPTSAGSGKKSGSIPRLPGFDIWVGAGRSPTQEPAPQKRSNRSAPRGFNRNRVGVDRTQKPKDKGESRVEQDALSLRVPYRMRE